MSRRAAGFAGGVIALFGAAVLLSATAAGAGEEPGLAVGQMVQGRRLVLRGLNAEAVPENSRIQFEIGIRNIEPNPTKIITPAELKIEWLPEVVPNKFGPNPLDEVVSDVPLSNPTEVTYQPGEIRWRSLDIGTPSLRENVWTRPGEQQRWVLHVEGWSPGTSGVVLIRLVSKLTDAGRNSKPTASTALQPTPPPTVPSRATPPTPTPTFGPPAPQHVTMRTVPAEVVVRQGESVPLVILLAPKEKLHWNNADPATATLVRMSAAPPGVTITPAERTLPQPKETESREERRAEFTVTATAAARPGPMIYFARCEVTYYCCTDAGSCLPPETSSVHVAIRVDAPAAVPAPPDRTRLAREGRLRGLITLGALLVVLLAGGLVAVTLLRRASRSGGPGGGRDSGSGDGLS